MAMIPGVELRTNKAERLPCVLIVDGSGSMNAGGAIHDLNSALRAFETELKSSDDVADSVQIAVIRMGDDDNVEILTDFVDAANFTAPVVLASGVTPMGKAVDMAMHMVEEQKQRYRQNSTTYKRPWIFLMSDGEPTDQWEQVATRARQAQEDRRFIFWAVGIGRDVPLTTLSSFCVGNRCFRLGEKKFKEMFEWLANSLAATSQRTAGQQATLPQLPTVLTVET